MSANGLCQHNNLSNYCPTCARTKAGVKRKNMSGMGAVSCAPGYYELKVLGISTGQCLPNLSTAANAAQTGVTSSVATGVATNPNNVTAAQQAGISAMVTSATNFIKAHPIGVAVGVGTVLLMTVYGSLSFARGK